MSRILKRLALLSRETFAVAVVAFVVLAFGASTASADGHSASSIVGLWEITVKDSGGNFLDSVFSGWTSDGLEFDQDIAPILTGYVCYGTWIKLGGHSYGLTHPFFTFDGTTGLSDGNSAYFNYTVTVSNDGKSFTGKENIKVVAGLNPYDPGATVLFTETGITLSATKIKVDKTLLP
jgi:hypothetical protein